ncbi:phosphoribosylanthranilate isomerase [Candidatus Poribacteria bacterium]
MLIKIKVCGITNSEDAHAAVDLGADALGFIFVPNTPRYVEPQTVERIISELPPFITTVGVFADAPPETVSEIIQICDLNAAQLHGSETPSYCNTIATRCRVPVIKAFRIKDQNSLSLIPEYEVSAYLLDTYVKGKKGGTGEIFNWDLAKEAKEYGRIIIAGGLTPENVAQAIRHVEPYAVDVSSGVESKPGKKDHAKVRAFIENIRALC